jgi:hypothetical protein
VGKAKLELKSSQVKGGELYRVEVKLWEGLSWIGRGCGGLPTVSRARRRQRTGGDGGSGARGEMQMQESVKWREEKLLNILDQQRRVGEARMGASHDGGEVAAGQSSGRGRATWSAREKTRGEELVRRPAWRRRVGATRAGDGADRAAAAVSGGGLRWQRGSSAGGRAAWHARGRPAGRG